MNASAQARNWAFAFAGGGATLLLLFLTLRLPIGMTANDFTDLPPLAPGPALRVRWNGNQPEASVVQAAQLMDPTPLFMPTALSAASKRMIDKGIADRFPALTPKDALKFQTGDLRLEHLPSPVVLPDGPAEALAANPPGNLAMGFGRSDQLAQPLPAREAWVEVTAPGSGKVMLRIALPAGAIAGLPGSNWQPVYFSATVNATGLVGSVISMPAPPSDGGFLLLDAETAGQLANCLETRMDLGQRLPPGFYRISVGP